MTDIVDRLNITADMISLGDKIRYGSDSQIMREAAAEIEKLRAALKPFADKEYAYEGWADTARDAVWLDIGDLRAAAAALKETGMSERTPVSSQMIFLERRWEEAVAELDRLRAENENLQHKLHDAIVKYQRLLMQYEPKKAAELADAALKETRE